MALRLQPRKATRVVTKATETFQTCSWVHQCSQRRKSAPKTNRREELTTCCWMKWIIAWTSPQESLSSVHINTNNPQGFKKQKCFELLSRISRTISLQITTRHSATNAIYLITLYFRDTLISRFSRFSENRENLMSRKLSVAKICMREN